MNGLLRNIEKILRNRRTRRKLQRTISLFAAIVVFITTYSLVIPAITMEKNAGCGIEEHQHDDSCYEDQLICGLEESEEHQHTADCYERVLVCGKEAHTHSAACYPADTGAEESTGSTDSRGTVTEGTAGDGVDVTVDSAEGGQIEVPVSDFSDGTVSTDSSDGSGQLTDGLLTEDPAAMATDPAAAAYPAAVFDGTIDVRGAALTTDTEVGAADGLQTLPEETTSLFVHVEADEETFPEGTTMVLSEVTDDSIDSVAAAVEGALSTQDAALNAGQNAQNASQTQTRTRGFHALDISFYDLEGNKIEPLRPVRVSITSDAIRTAVQDETTVPVVVHVENETAQAAASNEAFNEASGDPAAEKGSDENAAATDLVMNSTLVKAAETTEAAATGRQDEGADANAEQILDTLTFEAGAFSVYAIVYTVDFYWEVDGNTYDFSIPGGGYVSLYDLVKDLGIAEDKADTEKDEIRELVDGVERIDFSNPELVSVSKAGNNLTVGAIKNGLGIECEYSADLTEEQIAEINAQEVMAGDWALISLKPFDTEESMTVTMINGETWTVKVTDAQISTHVITADGETYCITVTYGPEAGIPEGADLEVTELVESTLEWNEYYNQAANAIGGDSLSYARFFDIKIIADGEEIEPQAPVETKIEYDSGIPLNPDSNPKAIHFADDGIEVIDTDVDDEEFASVFTFEQGSFSVTGTVVSELADGQYLIYGYDVTHNGTHYTDKSYTNNPNWAYKNVTGFSANYYALQYNNVLSATSLDKDNTSYGRAYYTGSYNSRVLWTVTKNGDGYLIANGSNYLRNNNGSLTTTTSESRATVWTYQNGQLSDGQRYLVYDRSYKIFSLSTEQPVGTNIYFAWNNPGTTGYVTIHYMLDNGDGTFSQSSQTTLALQSNSINKGAQYDLRQGIPSGMQYERTYVTDVNDVEEFSGSGTEIHYFLQTNYGLTNANYNNTSYRGWLYRETTSWDFDYGVNGWPSNGGIAVTTVSAYRSFGDEKDIYVVYREAPASSAPSSEDVDAEAPKIRKDKIDNEDGTYDLELSVTGSANSSQSTSKANVAVVLDLSYSMLGQDTGVSGQSRLDACKAAIQSLASQLFALNEDAPGTIEAAYIGFAQRVLNEREINTTYTDYNSFMAAVNKSTTAAGTNWDAALEAVNNIQWSDGDPMFVIFVTDGQPNSYSNTASPTNGNNNYWDSGNYNILDSAGTAGNAAVTAAKAQVTALKNAGTIVYGIGAFINSTTDAYFVDQINIDSDKHFKANNTTLLNQNITKIVSDISKSVGFENVQVIDGITALTSTALVSGNAENFRYEVAKYNFDSAGNRTTKIEGTEATVTKNNDGTLTLVFPNGKTDTIRQASYNETNKQVTWSLGTDYQLRDGYSYDVKFTVWPSQESYDLIADLNNGISSWVVIDEATGAAKIVYGNEVPDHVLPEHGKREYGTEYTKQIAKSGNSYSLKTNVDNGNIVTYTKVKTVTENGVTTTTREDGQSEFKNPDPMPLNNQLLPLVKKWDDATDATQRPGSVSLDLHRTTPKTSSAAATDIVYLDKMVLSNDHVNTDGDWTYYNDEAVTDKDKISIAPGLMVSEEIDRFSDSYQRFTYNGEIYALLDTGHDYYFVENPLDYHFELTNYTYHPMLINGELWNVTFSYDDAGNITEVKLINKMSEISATNTLKGRLYVTKEVEIPEGAIGYDLKTTTFPITITLKDKDSNALVGEGPATDENPHLNGVMYRIQYGKNHPSSDEGWHEWSDEFQNCGRSSQKLFTNGVITENIYAGDAIYVGNLPAGATYEVTEGTLSGGWKLVSITYDDQTKKIAGNDEDQVTVKNTLPSFTVGILKTRQDGTTALKDAKFDLYGSDYYTEDSSGKTVVNSEAVALKNNLTSGTDGTFNLGFLAGGTYYLVETSAPDGYNKLVNPVIITVDGTSTRKKDNYPLYVTYEQDGQTISSSNEGVAITTETDDKGHVTYIYQLTVVNDEGVELPNTGGPGTNIIYLLGIMLSVFAGAGLVMKTCGKAA